MDIAVIDYGMGNLRSVAKALAHVAPAARIVVSGDPAVIREAKRVVLPGQSAMPDTIACLDATGLRDVVLECLRERPFLGVCLGLQMLFETSGEGPTTCLGAFAGEVRRFREDDMHPSSDGRLKIPHMGWSPVRQTRARPLRGGMQAATVVPEDPAALAQPWLELGAERLHLVDLNGAVAGKPRNELAIREVVSVIGDEIPVQLGGGIRDLDTIERYLDDGIG